MKHNCKICHLVSSELFPMVIQNKYHAFCFRCPKCGFVYLNNIIWLKKAYADPISASDTGILYRNHYLSKIATVLIYFFFKPNSKFLDYAGGYGIFTRLMRDIGFNYYWSDPMVKNIFSQDFIYTPDMKIELLTAFECFEHFDKPLTEINRMLKISKNILFTTELIPKNNLNPDWWYFGTHHGQHVSFYSEKTFIYLAEKYHLNYYNLNGVGLITQNHLNKTLLLLARKFVEPLFYIVTKRMKPLTFSDMELINELH